MDQARTLEDVYREICARYGPLKERLDDFSKALRDYGLPFAEAYDALVARLESGEAGAQAPIVGDLMPSIRLPDSGGRLVSLDNRLGEGPIVVSFNRGHWCEYCALELSALYGVLGEIARQGAGVVSTMPETGEFMKSAATACGGGVEILSDFDNGYGLEAGLAIWLGDEVRSIYLEHGLAIEKHQASRT